ncbi:MAG: helix-turn-helix domain-containing protein [Shimia sp.]
MKDSAESLQPMAVPTAIVPLHTAAANGEWRLSGLHAGDDPRVIWITKGQGRAAIGGLMRAFGPNTLIYLPARFPFAMEVARGLQGAVVTLSDAAASCPSEPFHSRKRDALEQAEFVAAYEGITREAAQARSGWETAVAAHARLMAVWITRQGQATGWLEPKGAAQKLVRRYLHLLEGRYPSQLDVAGYAEVLGVTPTHLSRSCRSVTGAAAHALLVDRVMTAARCALVDRDVPVKIVAEGLGFSSAAYFTRFFQGHAGQTPSAFRAAARSAERSETGRGRVAKLI